MTLSFTLFMAFFLTFASLLTLNRLAPSLGLIDRPSPRKVHKNLTPVTGGLAIAVGVSLCVLIIAPTLSNTFYWILLGALMMVLSGAYDDLRTLSVTQRFMIQSTVALIVMVGADLRITSLGTYPIIGALELGVLSYPLTLFAILTGINSINLIDGLDGLASGVCAVAFCALSLLASLNGQTTLASFTGVVTMALIGFLSLNMRFPWQKSAKAFLGDAGSTALGFTLSCLVIQATDATSGFLAPTTALWILAIPLIDTLSVITRRLQNGRPPFRASKDHLHHILLGRLKSVSKAVNLLIVAAAVWILTGAALNTYGSDLLSLLLFLNLAVIHHVGASRLLKSIRKQAVKQGSIQQGKLDVAINDDQAAA